MTKDVLISVSGLQMGEEKPEQIEVISKGNFYQKNGYSYVFYDEVIEGFDQRVRNMIKFKNGALHVQKKGIVNVNMAFEEEKKNNTCYTTPYGCNYDRNRYRQRGNFGRGRSHQSGCRVPVGSKL